MNPKDEAQVSQAVALLVDGLKSPKPAVRLASVQALEGLGASAKIVGPALVGALKDSDPQVASEAIDVLGSMGPGITPEIVKALEIPALRTYALQILSKFGPKAAAAVEELVLLLDDPTVPAAIRREVHFTLGEIGPAAAPATPQLVGALGSDNERLRNRAIYALGHIGPDARPATKTLEALSASGDEFARIASLWALVQINPTDKEIAARAAPELMKGLNSQRELMRAESARVLGQMGAAGKVALPALKQAAADPSPVVAEAAKQAIAQLEGRAEKAPDRSSRAHRWKNRRPRNWRPRNLPPARRAGLLSHAHPHSLFPRSRCAPACEFLRGSVFAGAYRPTRMIAIIALTAPPLSVVLAWSSTRQRFLSYLFLVTVSVSMRSQSREVTGPFGNTAAAVFNLVVFIVPRDGSARTTREGQLYIGGLFWRGKGQ